MSLGCCFPNTPSRLPSSLPQADTGTNRSCNKTIAASQHGAHQRQWPPRWFVTLSLSLSPPLCAFHADSRYVANGNSYQRFEDFGVWKDSPVLKGSTKFEPLPDVKNIMITGGSGFMYAALSCPPASLVAYMQCRGY